MFSRLSASSQGETRHNQGSTIVAKVATAERRPIPRTDTLPLRVCAQNNVDPHKPVCIGLFRGGEIAHSTYGANQRTFAMRDAKRMRAQGVGVQLVWLNVGPWCADLWVQDLARPLEITPADWYGALDYDASDEPTRVVRRPTR